MMNSGNAMKLTTVDQASVHHAGDMRNQWVRRLVATTLISGVVATSPWQASAATLGTDGAQNVEIAQSTLVTFDIPAQELDRALTSFADQADVKLFFPSEGLGGFEAQALQGEMSIDAALGALLSGTGFTWRYTDGGTITIEKVAASGENVLDPVRVDANAIDEQADGPVVGYLATQSQAGTKTATPILETPQSISTVTSDQIADQGSQSVMDAVRYTPGVFAEQFGATSRYDYVVMRGMTENSVDNVYLDGMQMMGDNSTYSSMQVDPYFIDRADVVKGPASVLYGRSSPGGLVALSSKTPEFEQKGEAEVSYGNRNQRAVAFDVTGPLTEGNRLAYRVVGKADAQDTQFDYVEEERYVLAPSLTANFTDDTRLTVQAYLQRDPEGGWHNGVPAEGTLYPRNGQYISRSFFDGDPDLEKFDRVQNMVGYEFEHDFDRDWTLRHKLRYLDSSVDIDQVYQTGWSGTSNELTRTYYGGDETLRALSSDNQIEGNFSTGQIDHTVLAGLDYQHRRARTNYWYETASNINAFNPVYSGSNVTFGTPYKLNTKELEQTGVYLQDQFAYENWRFSLGLRQDWLETSNLSRLDDTRTGQDREKLTKNAGLLYLFDNGIAPYISYSESFDPSLLSDSNGDPIEPTEGTQYEAGIKYQPEGDDILLSAAVFDIRQDNVALYNSTTTAYDPAGSLESRGLELEARGRVNDNIDLIASYTYTDTQYDAPGDSKDGKQSMQVPEHMASLWGHYQFLSGPLNGLGLGGGVRYVGETWANVTNTQKVPDYAVLDFALNYDLAYVGFDDLDFRLNVNNLLDEEYVASCYTLANCYFGDARSIVGTLRYKF
ncbi:TonB-dependent siderophore receptor [Thalassospira lucentensis]|uniref:TonB-dependent siderophore receptor n=1 Tax=Thalassospira lucentensis TaxID=168935 RepID=UPI003D2AFAFD|tara:strand:+ start:18292 stop:20799 length:2508 start_codon:yes stop_codon:yes gene_type:complete